MPVSLFPLFDGLDQSFGDAAEGDGVDGWLGGEYSSHSIGRHAGIVGSKGAGHVIGGWRVRRGATGGFIGHVSIRHGGVEDAEDDAADVQAGPIDGTHRGVPCRRKHVRVHERKRCGFVARA